MKPHSLIKTMLTLAILLTVGSSPLSAVTEPSRKVSIHQHNVRLSSIVSQIESQTDYLFITEEGVDLNTEVSIEADNKEVSEIMEKVTEGTAIAYHIKGNYIMLSEKEILQDGNTVKKTIKGTVRDEAGEPLAGVYVFVNGTDMGTITDTDGKYVLEGNLPADAQLSFEYIGMKKQTVSVGSRKTIDTTLATDKELLEEVVVVGYGSESKINLTGSVASVKVSSVQNRAISNVSSALQGLVPGMTVTQAGGQPGMDVGTILVRGVGSFNTSSPMILIDGIEGNMNIVDPHDIESISVLKDASSASIYGSKAANGVILITTKRGKSGAPRVTYNGMVSWSSPADLMKQTTSAQIAQLTNEAEYYGALSDGLSEAEALAKMPYTDKDIELFADGSDPYGHANTDWYGLFFKGSGFTHKHNINVSGGNDIARYHASLGYNKQDGIIKNASNEQFNGRINVDVNISSKLSARADLSYTNTLMKEPTNPISWNNGNSTTTYRQIYRISPMVVYRYENGDYGYMADGNPIAWQDMGNTGDTRKDYINAFAEVKYNIIDGLNLKANTSYYTNIQDYTLYRGELWYDDAKYDGPIRLTKKSTKEVRKQAEVLLTYDKTFSRHTLNVLAGFHGEKYTWEQFLASRKGFPSNEVTDLKGGETAGQTTDGYTRALNMNSFFGRIKYNYDDRYLIEANVRADGTSRFAPEYRWGVFPSFSAAWRISNEDFMEPARGVISDMKIRGSWGILGNQDVNDYYPYINTYALTSKYPFDNKIQSGAAMTENKISNISWETTTTWGLALDATFFEDLSVTVEYYNKKTTGILMKVNVPSTYGYGGYWDNVGAMLNTGVEISLNYHKTFGEFLFNAGANFAYNHNEVLSLGDIDAQKNARDIVMVGKEYKAFYGYKSDGLFQSKEEIAAAPKYTMIDNSKLMPGDIKLVDVTGDGVINADDKIILTSENPKYTFAFNLGLQWRNFDINMMFQGAAGVSRYYTDEMYGELNGDAGHPAAIWMNRWTPEKPDNDFPRASKFRTYNMPDTTVSDFWLVDTSYLRLKDFQIGYTLPSNIASFLKLKSCRIYYDATNLLTFKSCPQGIDPEAPSGWGAYYPHIRTHSLGLTVTF